jgi:hypothetical protein
MTPFRHPEVSDAHLSQHEHDESESESESDIGSGDEEDSEDNEDGKDDEDDEDGEVGDGDNRVIPPKSGDGNDAILPDNSQASNASHDNSQASKASLKAAAKKKRGQKRQESPTRKSTRKRKKITHFSPLKLNRSRAAGKTLPPKHAASVPLPVNDLPPPEPDIGALSTEDELMQRKVVDLREYLREHHAPPSGLKEVLVHRILGVVKDEVEKRSKEESKKDIDGGTKELLIEMLRQQGMMIKLMQQKQNNVVEHDVDVNVCAVSKNKQNQESSSSARDNSHYVEIKPKPDDNSGHDMERYMRHSLDVAKLIEENASLRKDRLVMDMLRSVHE